MLDAARLYADAEQAQVRTEMARSRLLVAEASLHTHRIRSSRAKTRPPTASRDAGSSWLTPLRAGHAD
jgi:hypothetical protein